MYSDIFEQLNKINDEYLIEMANVRGKYVKHPSQLPFSFYFSSGADSKHSIRVKPSFNPDKLKRSLTGILKLSDDWEYIPGINDINISEKSINDMKQFFRDNIVLFVLVWDEFLPDGTVADFFEGRCTLNDVIKELDFYTEFSYLFDNCNTVSNLETIIRDNIENLTKAGYPVNFYGN